MKRTLVWVAVVVVAGAALFAPLPFDDVTRIGSVVQIAQPPERVFDYVTTPGNWPRWHPSSRAVHGATDHPLQLAEQVTEDFRVAGRDGQVVWTVIERDPPSHWKIAGSIDGHPAGSVRYDLEAIGAAPAQAAGAAPSTRFSREFDYRAPNLLFLILNRVSLRSQIQGESAAAVQGLKRELEAR